MFNIENTLSFNKDMLTIGDEYDYVTRTSQNQGILQTTGFVNSENLNDAGNWSLGLLQMDFFYRKKSWYAGQFVRKIIPKIKLSTKSVHFFSSILNKQKSVLLSVLVRDVDDVFRNIKIQLPTKNGKSELADINFDFIDEFVTELEFQRVTELELYLIATGLSSYQLTEKEQDVIDLINNTKWGGVNWGEFKIGELFEIKTSKKRFDANKITVTTKGQYPYIVRTALNNGVKGYLNEAECYLNEENTISFGQDTATIFYQKQPYFTGDKIKIVKSKHERFNDKNAQFFISVMTKAFSLFSWGSSSFNAEILKAQTIQLPIKSDGTPDYDLMETLISAVQKLVIKGVVDYADKKISVAKQIIHFTNRKK